jgi:hypothetical protein
VLDVVHGFPDADLWEKAENGEVVLGGCEGGSDFYACRDCESRW